MDSNSSFSATEIQTQTAHSKTSPMVYTVHLPTSTKLYVTHKLPNMNTQSLLLFYWLATTNSTTHNWRLVHSSGEEDKRYSETLEQTEHHQYLHTQWMTANELYVLCVITYYYCNSWDYSILLFLTYTSIHAAGYTSVFFVPQTNNYYQWILLFSAFTSQFPCIY